MEVWKLLLYLTAALAALAYLASLMTAHRKRLEQRSSVSAEEQAQPAEAEPQGGPGSRAA
jgi:hypothetical protein